MTRVSQTLVAQRVKEVLKLSEAHLIKVLKGETKLPERVVTQVALELYKRRVPQSVEGNSGNNSITMIKIVKNHLPGQVEKDVMDITPATHELAQTVEDKIAEVNEKIKAKQERSRIAAQHLPSKEK